MCFSAITEFVERALVLAREHNQAFLKLRKERIGLRPLVDVNHSTAIEIGDELSRQRMLNKFGVQWAGDHAFRHGFAIGHNDSITAISSK
jgi:hypothetical protein